jgi:hypothetical protein
MKSAAFVGLALAFIAGTASAGNRCEKVEHAQLKVASKSELRDEYCYATRRAQSYDGSHRIIREAMEKKYALGLDARSDQQASMEALEAAGSCKIAAGAFADALSRRFKSKPPPSCD